MVTRLPTVRAALAGISGLIVAISPFIFQRVATVLGPIPFLLSSSLMVWLSGYFLTQHFFGRWAAWKRFSISIVSYLLIGFVVPLTIVLSGHTPQQLEGVVMVLAWPIYLVFLLANLMNLVGG